MRIVVKVGTSTLTNAQGRIDRSFIADLTAQLAALKHQGNEVILVTSGAIRAGQDRLQARNVQRNGDNSAPTPPPKLGETLPFKQAAAAIGQGALMHAYTEAFSWRDTDCAQVLLTREDLSDRKRFLNARNTLLALISLGVIPVINENDTVAVDEIKFGDNDLLAALVATLIEADLLLILSDVEGLYNKPPLENALGGAPPQIIRTVDKIDGTLEKMAGGSISGMGTGGMSTKLQAAKIATSAGIRTVIARGRRERVALEVAAGEIVGTSFSPCAVSSKMTARKRWLAHSARPKGCVLVNERAEIRLKESGVSLLAAGIVEVRGSFNSGDLIEICDPLGRAFARGLTNYSEGEIRRVQGLKSEEFESKLGYAGFEEIIHRDNLVVGEQ